MSAQDNRPIVVGGKPTANYALAVAHRIGNGAVTVTLRARGRFVASAFDAANMAVNNGLPVERGGVKWGQEQADGGKQTSFVEISLTARSAT